MTNDNIVTRRHYRNLYWNWPTNLIVAHLITIDARVAEMKADDMVEARQLIDERLPLWR